MQNISNGRRRDNQNVMCWYSEHIYGGGCLSCSYPPRLKSTVFLDHQKYSCGGGGGGMCSFDDHHPLQTSRCSDHHRQPRRGRSFYFRLHQSRRCTSLSIPSSLEDYRDGFSLGGSLLTSGELSAGSDEFNYAKSFDVDANFHSIRDPALDAIVNWSLTDGNLDISVVRCCESVYSSSHSPVQLISKKQLCNKKTQTYVTPKTVYRLPDLSFLKQSMETGYKSTMTKSNQNDNCAQCTGANCSSSSPISQLNQPLVASSGYVSSTTRWLRGTDQRHGHHSHMRQSPHEVLHMKNIGVLFGYLYDTCPRSPECRYAGDDVDMDLSLECPPMEFTVEHNRVGPVSSSTETAEYLEVMPAKVQDLLEKIRCAVSKTINFCDDSEECIVDNLTDKNIDCIIRRQLCPSIRELLEEGVKKYNSSSVSSTKRTGNDSNGSSLWTIIELFNDHATPSLAEAKSLAVMIANGAALKMTSQTRNSQMMNKIRVNCYLMTLLNKHQLLKWLSMIQEQRSLLLRSNVFHQWHFRQQQASTTTEHSNLQQQQQQQQTHTTPPLLNDDLINELRAVLRPLHRLPFCLSWPSSPGPAHNALTSNNGKLNNATTTTTTTTVKPSHVVVNRRVAQRSLKPSATTSIPATRLTIRKNRTS